MLKTNI